MIDSNLRNVSASTKTENANVQVHLITNWQSIRAPTTYCLLCHKKVAESSSQHRAVPVQPMLKHNEPACPTRCPQTRNPGVFLAPHVITPSFSRSNSETEIKINHKSIIEVYIWFRDVATRYLNLTINLIHSEHDFLLHSTASPIFELQWLKTRIIWKKLRFLWDLVKARQWTKQQTLRPFLFNWPRLKHDFS